MKHGSHYGHKGMSGAYAKGGKKGGSTRALKGKNPFASRKMTRPKDVSPSHKGYA